MKPREAHQPRTSTHNRGMAFDELLIVLVPVTALLMSGWVLWSRYSEPRQGGDPAYMPQLPRVSDDLSDEETLQRLLGAVERRDYSGVEAFAKALFDDRADAALGPAASSML